MKYWELPFGTDEEEFEHYVGRKPLKDEMNEWVSLLKRGIESQIDWDMIGEEASKNFKK